MCDHVLGGRKAFGTYLVFPSEELPHDVSDFLGRREQQGRETLPAWDFAHDSEWERFVQALEQWTTRKSICLSCQKSMQTEDWNRVVEALWERTWTLKEAKKTEEAQRINRLYEHLQCSEEWRDTRKIVH